MQQCMETDVSSEDEGGGSEEGKSNRKKPTTKHFHLCLEELRKDMICQNGAYDFHIYAPLCVKVEDLKLFF